MRGWFYITGDAYEFDGKSLLTLAVELGLGAELFALLFVLSGLVIGHLAFSGAVLGVAELAMLELGLAVFFKLVAGGIGAHVGNRYAGLHLWLSASE